MFDLKWSDGEKKLARRVYEAALQAELAEVMADFRARAAAVTLPEELWALEDYLREKRLGIDQKYDYRYSQLIRVFGQLTREGRIQAEQLQGLSQEKLDGIQRFASL